MNRLRTAWLCLLLMAGIAVEAQQTTPALKISSNNRFFANADGSPFFWLGDTGWLLFSKLTREEAVRYLSDRKAKGFNVIQAMVLHTVKAANVYGDSALIKRNVATPLLKKDHDYWQHVDYIVDQAAAMGIYVAMVPIWGTDVKEGYVNSKQAAVYASFLAKRYGPRPNIIWMNGGDIKGSDSLAVWNTIGNTLYKLDKKHLITFHPRGRTTSSIWFHKQPWLHFNTFQSGHRRYDQDTTKNEPLHYGEDNWKFVEADLKLKPLKPSFDAEPSYEGIPQGLHDTLEVRWKAEDVRRYGYWSVFAGGCGYTYGNNAVMQMRKHSETATGAYGAHDYWDEAINDPGAGQMIHLKNLMLARPYFERIPDQSLIASGQGEKYERLLATRGKNYVYVYTYTGRNMNIALGKITGKLVHASWYDPRTGQYKQIGDFENKGTREFNPPGEPANGNDWVLVLDGTNEPHTISTMGISSK
ncbi:glycoside hydrolase family 140 protein [Filimonas effusa]|uniref:DUF4038 domain-containing protein n=1 Tax=Filimonas effusa TaxID=2508721 RepID=A0A4Q1DBA6_9BACT|nr:glycoside hydrolase family 140 protein [Filimonas effusa]RXK86722.1 DUF4038 domain-containing protein [Filimonas effusa]